VTALHSLLVFFHVLAVSLWMAAPLWVSGDVRRTLGMGHPYVDGLAARVRPALGLDAAAGIATVVTGALLVWEEQLGMPRPGITAGIVLTLLRLGVLAALRRAWRSIFARLQAGEPVAASDPAARRMPMRSGSSRSPGWCSPCSARPGAATVRPGTRVPRPFTAGRSAPSLGR
jgi:hypothetical protein